MKRLGLQILVTISFIALAVTLACTNQNGTQAVTGAINPFTGYNANSWPSPTPLPTYPTPAPGTTTTAIPTPPPLSSGDTETLSIPNAAALSTYVGTPLNNPGPVQVNISLAGVGNSPVVYLGTLHIRYYDEQPNGQLLLHDGTFSNGTDSSHGNNVHILTTDSATGRPAYRIMFEDPAGVLTLIIEQASSAGGDAGIPYSGTIYYHNFNTTAPNPLFQPYEQPVQACDISDPNCVFAGGLFYYQFPQNPYAWCWAGSAGPGPQEGPYDCANFNVPLTSGSPSFTQLGTISNINVHNALGI